MSQAVYGAINRVMAALVATGIGKGRENKDQGFMFRGIDDIYNELAPVLSREKLCILPKVVSREVMQRTTASGKTTYNVAICADFAFVSTEDGSHHTVTTFGEANDQQDKATNKAMSAAYKYACFQAFCIPLEGHDADADQREAAWDGQVADWLAKLEEAADADAGKAVYKSAVDACKKQGDVDAAKRIKAALLAKFPEAGKK